jgi:hypothetical protein
MRLFLYTQHTVYEWYQEGLALMRDAVPSKRPELWETQSWLLRPENAPAPASLFMRNYLAKRQTSVVSPSALFSGLIPSRPSLVSHS